jgi:hypothetical protein
MHAVCFQVIAIDENIVHTNQDHDAANALLTLVSKLIIQTSRYIYECLMHDAGGSRGDACGA